MTAPDEFLAPIRERVDQAKGSLLYREYVALAGSALADVPRLLAALDGVLALADGWLSEAPDGEADPSQLWERVGKKHAAVKVRAAIQTALEGQG